MAVCLTAGTWRGWSRARQPVFCGLAFVFFSSVAFASSPSAHAPAVPAGLTSMESRGHRYFLRVIDPKTEDLRLFWKGSSGDLLHDFHGLGKEVDSEGERLVFAANAGMFEPDFSPVGLLVLNGEQIAPLNLKDGTGNFYLKPNGVFVLTDQGEARVMETGSFETFLPRVLWATQSGPLLVHEGEIHPDLVAGSSNLMIRSGVGVRADGKIVFALSRSPLNLPTTIGKLAATVAFLMKTGKRQASRSLILLKCSSVKMAKGLIISSGVPKLPVIPHPTVVMVTLLNRSASSALYSGRLMMQQYTRSWYLPIILQRSALIKWRRCTAQ